MDLDLTEWLAELASSEREDPETRALAQKLWQQDRSGITVSPASLRRLRQLKKKAHLCARLGNDGTCEWLRKYAASENVIPPRPGVKMFCHRRSTGMFDVCNGFKELKGD